MVPLSTASLVVRWLHVLAMAAALGGVALAWAVLRGTDGDADSRLAVATTCETVFWGALGVLVATGVGNLGALAPAIPRGRWSAVLLVKLGLVLAVLVGSAIRTVAVREARRDADPATTPIERGYALTAFALVVVVGLAEVLAHG